MRPPHAPVEGDPAAGGHRIRRLLDLPGGEQPLGRFRELGVRIEAGTRRSAPVPPQELGTLRVLRRRQRERAAVQLPGGVDGSEPEGTLGGHDERGPRMRVELGIGPPAARVSSSACSAVVRERPRRGPRFARRRAAGSTRRRSRCLRARCDPRDLAVGDVADERMPEGVLRLLRLPSSGAPAARIPFSPVRAELLELAPLGVLPARAPSQNTFPTTAASCSSCFSSAGSPSRRAAMIPCSVSGSGSSSARRAPPSHRDESRGRRACARTARRRAGCPRRARAALLDSAGEQRLLEQRRRRAARCPRGERRERDRDRVELSAAPAGPPLEQLRARRADTSSGTPPAHSTRWSTKSSSPSSAQCRSSKTRTSGRCSASASKKRRQAANASLAARRPRSPPSPTSGRRWTSTQSRPRARRDRDRRVELRARAVGCVGLEHARLRLDHLAERPERDPVAVREAAALPPGDQLGLGVDVARRAPRRAGSCRCPVRRRASRAAASARARTRSSAREHVKLALAADERRARAARTSTPKRDRASSASQTGTGSAFPLASTGSALAVVDRRSVARQVGSSTSTPFTGARRLQARRRVDDVARGHPLSRVRPRVERDERLAGGDPDADLQVAPSPR